VADELRKESGADVQVKDGNRGEFTVLVDGREVAKKSGDHDLPPVQDVVAAVRKARPATAGTKK
jgi:hypothetical protein